MSITDELREWSWDWSATNRSLDKIADRIDKAHDKALMGMVSADSVSLMEHYSSGVADGIEIERENIREGRSEEFICSPKDKNGKVIHVGDIVTMKPGSNICVDTIEAIARSNTGFIIDNDASTLIEPDSQEKIDADIYLDECKYFGGNDGQSCEQCPNYENKGDDCLKDMIQDLLRRQRALDGVK